MSNAIGIFNWVGNQLSRRINLSLQIFTIGSSIWRIIARDGELCWDYTITELGFDGDEDIDWVCAESTEYPWDAYWALQTDSILFYGELSEIVDGKLYNQMQGASDYLTVVDSTPGAETFQCPDNATYKTADEDFIWFNPGGEQRTVTTTELVSYDFSKTIVKYNSSSPFQIDKIIILSSSLVLTEVLKYLLMDYAQLSLWWDGTLSDHGYLKGNRGIGRSVWQIQMPFVDDLNLLIESRDALTLPASVGSDGSILPSIPALNGSNNYLTFENICPTNKSFDITLTAIWDAGNYRGGLCAYSNNNQLGRIDSTSTKISFVWVDLSVNSIFSSGNGDMTIVNGVPVTVRIIKNDVDKTITIIKDGVTIVDAQAWNAAFLNNVNNIYWLLGRWFTSSYCGMKPIYLKIIGDAGTNEWFFNGVGNFEYDVNGAFVATYSGTYPHVSHNALGSSQYLDSGYKIYSKAGQADEYVPTGGSVTALLAAGYSLTKTVLGNVTKHNLAPSLIQFAGAVWDRSDATIWSASARAGYYDATNATTRRRWHISELNQNTINSWANAGYKGLNFVKIINNSVNDRLTLDQLFGYDTEKTGDSLNGVLTYTNDIGLL